jgi:hypothetical protein
VTIVLIVPAYTHAPHASADTLVGVCCLQDILSVLQARTAAAALMRAASTTTASLLVHLSDSDLKPFDACSLLDAIVCECCGLWLE